jgi:predicted AlkP superfamily phosphohydrolase/phosphomutase
MLSNSLAAALLASAYVFVLILQLNPTLPLNPSRVAPIALTICTFYALHLTVIFYVLHVLRQIFAHELFSPAWISVGVLLRLAPLAALTGAALMWANARTFAVVLEAATVRDLTNGAWALAACAMLFVFIALLRAHFGSEHRPLWAALLILIAAVSVAAPVAMRGRGVIQVLDARPIDVTLEPVAANRAVRVTVLAIDAGSLDFVTGATAEGRLPNFGRIMDAGAVVHLATIHPTSPEVVWAAVATGKLPQKNGVRSAGVYRLAGGAADAIQLLPDFCYAHALVRFGFLVDEPHTSATLRARTLWGILSTLGTSVGVVGWPLTQPAPVVRGYLVSDTYPRVALTASGIENPSAVYPPDLQTDVSQAMEEASSDESDTIPVSLGMSPAVERTDRVFDRIAQVLGRARPVQVSIVRYQGLDPVGHYYLRYATPSEFGDVSEEERRRYGSVLERHYNLIDAAIGRAIAALGPDDLLLVVSGFGMEPLGLAKRAVERLIGDPELSGTHDAAPDGFLMAYGGSVARGRFRTRAHVVDVVPTLLYFLGLPVGRDMDGYARTDLFQPAFTAEHPITFIPSYDR